MKEEENYEILCGRLSSVCIRRKSQCCRTQSHREIGIDVNHLLDIFSWLCG